MRSVNIRHAIELLCPVVFTLLVVTLCFSSWFFNYAVIGGDTYWHLLKIEYLSNAFRNNKFFFVDWYDLYFAGCFFLHTAYPPVYYYLGILLNIAFGDVFIAYKVLILFSIYISGIGAYFLTLELAKRKEGTSLSLNVGAVTAAVIYSLSPFILREITLGEAALVLAWGFAPWIILTFVNLYVKPSWRNTGIFSFLVAILFLTHHHFLYFTLLSGFIYLLTRLIVEGEYGKIISFPKIILGGLLALGLAAYWMIPYVFETESLARGAAITSMRGPSNIAHIAFFLNRNYAWTGQYIGISVFFLILLGVILMFMNKNKAMFAPIVTALFSISVACYYPLFEILPLSSTAMFPVRSFISISLFLSVTAGMSIAEATLVIDSLIRRKTLRRYLKPVVLSLIIALNTSVIVWDFTPALRYACGRRYSREEARLHGSEDLKSVIQYLQVQPGNGRVLALPSSYSLAGSYGLYLPAITGKPLFDGTGSASPVRMDDYLTMAYMSLKNTPFNFDWVLTKIREYNIEYIVVSKAKTDENLVSNLIATGDFTIAINNRAYMVLKNRCPAGLVQMMNKKLGLVIGNYGYLRDILSSIKEVHLVVGNSRDLRDYSLDYLMNFDVIFCYDFMGDVKKLEEYVLNGGVLVVDLDNSAIESLFLVRSKMKSFVKDRITVSYNRLDVNISEISLIGSPWKPWDAVYYEGLDEVYLEIEGKYSILGVEHEGKGIILFVGFNLFYYTELFKNLETKNLLREFIKSFILSIPNRTRSSLKSSFLKFTPEEKVIQVEVSNDSYVFISLTYDPFHWKCLMDGKQVEVIDCNSFYLIKVPKGKHIITLRLGPTLIDYLSFFLSVCTLMIIVILIAFNRLRIIKRSF